MSVVPEPTIRKKLSICLVQVGAIEESFRSLMALKAVKHLYPDTAITVICRLANSAPFLRIDWIDQVHVVPDLKSIGDPEAAVSMVARWIDQVIGKESYELLCNWTWSRAHQKLSRYLTAVIPALVKFGDSLKIENSGNLTPVSLDAWSMYHHAWANDHSQVEQDIHPTDIITTQLLTALQIHLGDPRPDTGSIAVTSKYFFKVMQPSVPTEWIQRPKGLRWVAIHYGSLSSGELSGGGSRVEEWIEIVLRRHPDAGIVILNDSPVAIEMNSPRVLNLSGQTQFDASVQVLTQCHWLVSGRSPIVDLASLLNTRVFYMVEGSGLKWMESGPYGNTHLVLQFSEFWESDVAYAIWAHAQSEWFHRGKTSLEEFLKQTGLYQEAQKSKLYQSRIRPAADGGGVTYERRGWSPEQRLQTSFDEWMLRIRGQMARAWFCGWIPPVEAEASTFQLNPDLLQSIRKQQESLGVLKQLLLEGAQVGSQLERAAQDLPSSYLMSAEDREEIESYGKKLLELEGLMARVVRVEPSLGGFLKLYQHLVLNLRQESISGMAAETRHAFELAQEGLELLEQYIRRTLELARPKVVAAAEVRSTFISSTES